MGSRPKTTDLAYIAGFLDGDGSLMLQIKKRQDGNIGWRFMLTICFYQDSRHSGPLTWIREQLGIGFLTKRNDGMTELRINGYVQVRNILESLLPFIRFKKIQAETMLKIAKTLASTKISELTDLEKEALREAILIVQKENYQSRRKRSKQEISKVLGLTSYRLTSKEGEPEVLAQMPIPNR